ncbi:cobalt-precorrin-6A reductase [Pseudooceanicola nanhaiensis]|uniref:cobalt-precorrin-6A reductase n=1 Tax=Pseudooceanicola nanhaiensis TaxID=375761 RepID=UPI003514F49F
MILVLAGTAEARALCEAMAAAGIAGVASLSGAVAAPAELALPVRIGGFGGEAGFRDYLAAQGITGVVDATHPFAARITGRTARVCKELGLPLCLIARPAWAAGPGDEWVEVTDPEALDRVIPRGARVLLTVGRKEIARYHGLKGREVLVRSIEPVDDLPEGWRSVTARPPFTAEDEAAFFALTGIGWLVTKNAGGGGTGKLEAARAAGVRVAMISRPALPEGVTIVETVEAAMEWVRGR